MSPVVRAGLVFGLVAAVAVAGSALLPLGGCLSFLSVIALGLGVGYTAAKVSNAAQNQRIGRGATAGAIAGSLALLGAVLIAAILSATGFYEAQIAAGLAGQSQELRDAGIDPAQLVGLGSAAGIIGGVCGGLFNLAIMALCGLLGSLFWKGAPAAQYVPAGGAFNAPPSGSYIPQQSNQAYTTPQPPADQTGNPSGGAQIYGNQQGYGNQDTEGGARIYPDDPNRPPQ